MNAQDKKNLTNVKEQMEESKAMLEGLAASEQEKFDNLSEQAQEGEIGQALEAAASNLSDAVNDLENVISAIDQILEG